MSCPACENIQEADANAVHVTRKCDGCGRPVRYPPTLGKHGRGLVITKGDQFTFPASMFQFSLDPLKSTGTATPYGLATLATQLFFPHPGTATDYPEQAREIERQFDSVIDNFAPATGLDVNAERDQEALAAVMLEQKDKPEYWAWVAGIFSAMRRAATEQGDLSTALWATAVAERARSMWAYKTKR